MSTFVQLQNDANDLLQEIQNHPQYTLAKLKSYINRGNEHFVAKTRCIEGYIDVTTVANQFSYNEVDESDLLYLMKPVQFRYIDGTQLGEKLKPFPGGFTNLPKEYSYGNPDYYWIQNIQGRYVEPPTSTITRPGVRIGTWPIASTSAKTIRIHAFLWPALLNTDANVPEYNSAWHDAPVYYAVSRMFGMFSHLRKSWAQKSVFYMQEFERLVADANETFINQSDEPIEIEDVYYQMDEGII